MELQIRNVSKTYPNGTQALKDVTLTVPAGTYGLLGPSGAGKSTLMRILAALQEPDAGSVRLDDVDVLNHKDQGRRMLGYLPQELAGSPRLSADHLLDRLGNVKLLLVDELPASLDPAERTRLLDLLRERGENSIVLLATHNVDDVRELCARMAIIHEGRILLEGEPRLAADDLYGRIWHREIAKEALPKVEREYAVISAKLLAGRTVVRVYSNTAPAVGFERARPDLEDVYLSAIRLRQGFGVQACPAEAAGQRR